MTQLEWEAQRIGKFTASEIHKLMGTPRKKGETLSETAKSFVIEKAAEILTGQKRPIYGAALDWGVEHEQEAFLKFNVISDQMWEYYGGQEFKFYSYGIFSGASPDGLSVSHLLEIKCPYESHNHIKHMLIKDNEDFKSSRPEYYWQMQLGMIATEKSKGMFVSYDPRMPEDKQIYQIEIYQDDVKAEIDEKISVASEMLAEIIS